MMYGTLFMMSGAYTLSQDGHVRGDFLYGSMRPRTQAALDLILYIVFFLPGIVALIWAGYDYAGESWRSASTRPSPPTGCRSIRSRPSSRWPARSCMLQGIAEIVRCVVCLQDWRLAEAAQGRRPRSTSSRSSSPRSEYVDEDARAGRDSTSA